MKALVKYAAGIGNVELRDVEEPTCREHHVTVEVGACGICGTDLHVYHERFRNYPPVILGHEFAGVVVDKGHGVSSVSCGDRVAILPASAVTCGQCAYCRQGQIMFCPARRGMGHGVNGAFTRFATVREDQVFKIPDNVTLTVAALCEPMAAAVHAVAEKARPSCGDTVLLSGPGPIGLLCLKLLVAQGLRVFVVGTREDGARLNFAKQQGADLAIAASEDELHEIVLEQTAGRGVDLALECAGAAASVRNCLQALRPLGQLTQVGHFGTQVQLNYDWVAFKELEIRGSVGYTTETWHRVMRILAEDRIDLADMISHQLPLHRWRDGFDLCERKQALKVLLLYSDAKHTTDAEPVHSPAAHVS